MAEIKNNLGGASFGFALEQLNLNKKVARKGWNGKGMFVVLKSGYPGGAPLDKPTADLLGARVGQMRIFQPWLLFHTVEGSLVPWVASQTDLLARDWMTV